MAMVENCTPGKPRGVTGRKTKVRIEFCRVISVSVGLDDVVSDRREKKYEK